MTENEEQKVEAEPVSPVPEVPEVPKDVVVVEAVADAPLTSDQLTAKLELLSERAKQAGVSPLRVLGQVYVKRGLAVIDGLLSALEDGNPPKKKS